MMKVESYIKWFLFAFLSLFLVACKPTANFDYSPTAPSVGEVVKFDATKSTVYKAKEGNAISAYIWDFGDGVKGTGATIEHTYTKAGQYTVTLGVTDLAGQVNTKTQKITVKQGAVQSKDVTISVQSVSGASIPNAKVTIQGQSIQTDVNGLASLKVSLPQGTQQVVAQFEKEGFITQSIVYDVSTLKGVSASLLAIKQVVPVADIAQAQVIQSQHLGASITIPAAAFVQANGTPATGAITVEFTPWDITANDLNAMPANGMAQDAQGNTAQLISAGMISATFKDANGQELQLASGKTADIQMNLPLKSINNQEMKVGTAIPMWHFNEDKGLWIEEGVGNVVVSNSSTTGLAVHAMVSHFSTWNWDFKFENAGSVFVQCQSAGTGEPCNVIAKVTLNDGSSLVKSNNLPAEGTTIINMPSSGKIEWVAKDVTGTIQGEQNSGISGRVIIDLGKPTTENTVQCTLPNGTAVACSGKVNNQLDFSVSKDGGKIISGIQDADGKLDWSAQTGLIFEANEWVRYKGKTVSDLMGDVKISLTEREIVYGSSQNRVTFPVVCSHFIVNSNNNPNEEWEYVEPNGNWEVKPEFIGKQCKITVSVSVGPNQQEDFNYVATYGKPLEITLPEKYSGFVEDQEGVIEFMVVAGEIDDEGDGIYGSDSIGYTHKKDIFPIAKLLLDRPR